MAFTPHGIMVDFSVESFLGLQLTQEKITKLWCLIFMLLLLIKVIFSTSSHHISDDLVHDLYCHPQRIGEFDKGNYLLPSEELSDHEIDIQLTYNCCLLATRERNHTLQPHEVCTRQLHRTHPLWNLPRWLNPIRGPPSGDIGHNLPFLSIFRSVDRVL